MIRSAKQGSFFSAAMASVLFACWGCGDGAPSVSSSSTEATVHGTIKIDGKAVTGGTVSFDPSNVSRKAAPVSAGQIGKDGSYTVKTLVGGNRVSVNSPEVNKNPKLRYNSRPFDVQSGDNTFDFDLTAPAAAPATP